ncbi:hypothetical protein DIPPA_02545 [Diplonema papillatum]|nr:hypothetical protein DIPPA_02545 [Diplonema papillatum]
MAEFEADEPCTRQLSPRPPSRVARLPRIVRRRMAAESPLLEVEEQSVEWFASSLGGELLSPIQTVIGASPATRSRRKKKRAGALSPGNQASTAAPPLLLPAAVHAGEPKRKKKEKLPTIVPTPPLQISLPQLVSPTPARVGLLSQHTPTPEETLESSPRQSRHRIRDSFAFVSLPSLDSFTNSFRPPTAVSCGA